MKTLAEYRQIVKDEIQKQFFDKQIEPKELFEPINYILEIGGKRLRPALCLLACNLFSEEIRQAVKPAIGLETFHNFTLLHDDIMDKSSMRRGKPTVHKKWNENTAILSGDAMLIRAYQFLEDINPKFAAEVFKVFNQTALDVCIGQQYDMNFENRPLGAKENSVSEEEYIHMISKKTSVLIAASLQIGAILGGASKENAKHLFDFGENLGLSFQLQDDLLDVFGNSQIFGKRIGGDILANKKTFLLIKAYELLENKKDLENLLNLSPETEDEKQHKIKEVTALYNSVNVKKLAEEKISFFYNKALESLTKVKLKAEKEQILTDFAQTLIKREK